MSNLREASIDELIAEITRREGVRSMQISKNEYVKAQVHLSATYDNGTRYLKGYGPGVILEITKRG